MVRLAGMTSRWLAATVAFCWSVSCGVGSDSGPTRHSGSDAGRAGSRSDAELVARFESEGAAWIRAERARYRPLATPLSEADRRRFSGYFPQELLAATWLVEVSGFENPEFFSIFEDAGEARPLDLRQASALALVDTIVITEEASASSSRDRVLFHELVHLVQYDAMGLAEYMRTYAESWAGNGRSYRAIRHEAQAFELATRFTAGERFWVPAQVDSRFADTNRGDRDQKAPPSACAEESRPSVRRYVFHFEHRPGVVS